MSQRDFTLTLTVTQTPEEVFEAVRNVRGWWSAGLEGPSAAVGDEFVFTHEDIHRSVHRVVQAVPGKCVVWRTLEADVAAGKDRAEWTGTEVRFDIARKGGETQLRFTHVGLVPEFDCFEACSRGWTYFVGESLRKLITTGKGSPDPVERARPTAGRDARSSPASAA